MTTSAHRDVAEAGWRWVLDEVARDPGQLEGAGIHSGWGGLGLALAEVRRSRPWTDEETAHADTVIAAVGDDVATTTDATWFDGLPGHVDVLLALGGDPAPAVDRLIELAQPDGWPTDIHKAPRYLPGARLSDATLGTAAVLRAGVAAARAGVDAGAELARLAADVLLAEQEVTPAGVTWQFVPRRFRTDEPIEMPNWSHGTAGVATALAEASAVLERPDLLDAARRGAEHLVALADLSGDGFLVPRYVPTLPDQESVSYGWCHGASGTSMLFTALAAAGCPEVAGEPPAAWAERCWTSVRRSGIPARSTPGFWDNDGRCCGTAGVGDLALDAALLDVATAMAEALVERAYLDDGRAWWRFVEHTADEPLLPPAVGWMQGGAGIVGFLFRHARTVI